MSLFTDIAHLLAAGMMILSFLLLYQDRITATLNVFAAQAIALGLAVAWQAELQDAPHLFVTAAIALVVKGGIIPMALHRIVRRLEIHREIGRLSCGRRHLPLFESTFEAVQEIHSQHARRHVDPLLALRMKIVGLDPPLAPIE